MCRGLEAKKRIIIWPERSGGGRGRRKRGREAERAGGKERGRETHKEARRRRRRTQQQGSDQSVLCGRLVTKFWCYP